MTVLRINKPFKQTLSITGARTPIGVSGIVYTLYCLQMFEILVLFLLMIDHTKSKAMKYQAPPQQFAPDRRQTDVVF